MDVTAYPLKKEDKNMIRIFERRILRKIYGLGKENTQSI
jgi:hypothetical protein